MHGCADNAYFSWNKNKKELHYAFDVEEKKLRVHLHWLFSWEKNNWSS